MATFSKRKTTDWLVVHCAATRPTQDIGAKEIFSWHRAKGYIAIGYHYVIRRDGTLETGRPDDVIGAHAVGANANSVGICMVGGVDDKLQPENNFTPAQFITLKSLLSTLKTKYPTAQIIGHRDVPGTKKACPSFDAKGWAKMNQL